MRYMHDKLMTLAAVLQSTALLQRLAIDALQKGHIPEEMKGMVFKALKGHTSKLEEMSRAAEMLAHVEEVDYALVLDWAESVLSADANGVAQPEDEVLVAQAIRDAAPKADPAKGH